MKLRIIFSLTIVSLLFLIAGLFFYLKIAYIKEEQILYVAPGDTYEKVLSNIESPNFKLLDPLIFLYIKANRLAAKLKTGEFKIEKNASLSEIIFSLSQGKNRIYHAITFPEGFTNYQILEKISASEVFCDILEPSELVEGILLPETYYIEKCSDQHALIQRMRVKQAEILARLWDERDQSLPFKNKEEAVILASIVEKETNVPEERAIIAGIFLNRLKKRMYLGSCATIVYALSGKKKSTPIRNLKYKHLKIKSPYNTYRNRGLPPTPIANPGYEALYAALHPEKTDFLYFVFDPTQKKHIFSKSLKAHNNNRKLVRSRVKKLQ